jgi:hypothetical protein
LLKCLHPCVPLELRSEEACRLRPTMTRRCCTAMGQGTAEREAAGVAVEGEEGAMAAVVVVVGMMR